MIFSLRRTLFFLCVGSPFRYQIWKILVVAILFIIPYSARCVSRNMYKCKYQRTVESTWKMSKQDIKQATERRMKRKKKNTVAVAEQVWHCLRWVYFIFPLVFRSTFSLQLNNTWFDTSETLNPWVMQLAHIHTIVRTSFWSFWSVPIHNIFSILVFIEWKWMELWYSISN